MVLELKSVTKCLGDFSLREVSLTVQNSEYFIILGPSGAGKTILLETIAGIHQPDSGLIFLDGVDITYLPARLRGIGMVYQDYMLFPHLSVWKNIGFGLKQQGVPLDEISKRVEETSFLLRISHLLDREPETLSGGEQQRVAIARALILKPGILLLDEPLSALDAVTRRRMRQELARIPEMTGTSVIHITHHAEDLLTLGHRSAVMQEGKVIQVGNPDEIFSSPTSPFVAAFTGMENFLNGISRQTPEGALVQIGQVAIHAITPLTGRVIVGLRAESLIFSTVPFQSSAKNHLHAVVRSVRVLGPWVRVCVDCGIVLTGVMTYQSMKEMALKPEMWIYVTFKASSVQVFPAEEFEEEEITETIKN